MKTLPFILSISASALCLVLGIWLFILGRGNLQQQGDLQKLQQEAQAQQQVLQTKQQQAQAQQEQINAGTTISQQVGPALLRDMAVASTKNEKMKSLLTKHGYNVELKPDAAAPGSTPAPASTPTPSSR
ncbi:MAG TPA: hypothetical protein VF593_13190 [Chthoniobacteraceae bacterium]|jgi:cytoskeletal protein RodZ